ncbi:MAG: leucine-rich repeat domain-containing protein, partial [Bacteroidota bacterium]
MASTEIENLRVMLYSGDPEVQELAKHLIEGIGFPDELVTDCFVLSEIYQNRREDFLALIAPEIRQSLVDWIEPFGFRWRFDSDPWRNLAPDYPFDKLSEHPAINRERLIELSDQLQPAGRAWFFNRANGEELAEYFNFAEEITFEPLALPRIPAGTASYPNLRGISCRHSRIEEVPSWISEIDTLEKLDLSHNGIRRIDPILASASALTSLDLSHNAIKKIDPFLSSAPCLQTLDLSHNKLRDIDPFNCEESGLKSLNLSHNEIQRVNSDLMEMHDLESLDLSHNRIRRIPDALFSMKGLRRLNLSGNLPKRPLEVRKLPYGLQWLALGDWEIPRFPRNVLKLKQLQHLDLSGNLILNLPPEIAGLTALRSLDISRTLISELPPELAEMPLQQLSIGFTQGDQAPIARFPSTLHTLSTGNLRLPTDADFSRFPDLY